jgi:hypothetical protein
MNRRFFLIATGAMLTMAPIAHAQSFADQIVQQLAAQGFVNIRVETTLLGRVRILGQGAQGFREIVLNPNTGAILRDTLLDANGNPIVPRLGDSNSGSGSGENGNSGSGSGDDVDDDRDDDDRDDDRDDDDDDDDDDRDDDRDDDDDDDRDDDDD